MSWRNWRNYFSNASVGNVASPLDEAGVTRAYRRRALKLHPDKAAPGNRAAAEERFKVLQKYYDDAKAARFSAGPSRPTRPARRPGTGTKRPSKRPAKQHGTGKCPPRSAYPVVPRCWRMYVDPDCALRCPGSASKFYPRGGGYGAAPPPPGKCPPGCRPVRPHAGSGTGSGAALVPVVPVARAAARAVALRRRR